MNSMEERALFESAGWEYDYIARQWVAPNGNYITLDDLVAATETPQGEAELIAIVHRYGREVGR